MRRSYYRSVPGLDIPLAPLLRSVVLLKPIVGNRLCPFGIYHVLLTGVVRGGFIVLAFLAVDFTRQTDSTGNSTPHCAT